ncbi:hypothetical protein ACFQ1S_18000, partial [Kibdelosporangium lantanae]
MPIKPATTRAHVAVPGENAPTKPTAPKNPATKPPTTPCRPTPDPTSTTTRSPGGNSVTGH